MAVPAHILSGLALIGRFQAIFSHNFSLTAPIPKPSLALLNSMLMYDLPKYSRIEFVVGVIGSRQAACAALQA